jgi:hypothetical protein
LAALSDNDGHARVLAGVAASQLQGWVAPPLRLAWDQC